MKWNIIDYDDEEDNDDCELLMKQNIIKERLQFYEMKKQMQHYNQYILQF